MRLGLVGETARHRSLRYDIRENGVKTWVVVIRDRSGAEVFRDGYTYSIRHGVGVTWLSTADQLWILSRDVGTAHVDRAPDGSWTKTAVTPEP